MKELIPIAMFAEYRNEIYRSVAWLPADVTLIDKIQGYMK